tara:strand:- start:412 stop:723 length:312 start_codon:yes stop_codon:yes gene_type:complete
MNKQQPNKGNTKLETKADINKDIKAGTKITPKSTVDSKNDTRSIKDIENPKNRVRYLTCDTEIVKGKRLWYYLYLRKSKDKEIFACKNDETEKKLTLFRKIKR